MTPGKELARFVLEFIGFTSCILIIAIAVVLGSVAFSELIHTELAPVIDAMEHLDDVTTLE